MTQSHRSRRRRRRLICAPKRLSWCGRNSIGRSRLKSASKSIGPRLPPRTAWPQPTFCARSFYGSLARRTLPMISADRPTSAIPTKRSSTSCGGVCSGAILSGDSMDPLEKFKTDFVRARGEAYQPGEKPGEKPRPRRKQNTQAQKPTPVQNNLREFGDALPGDELDNNPPHQINADPPPAMSPEEYGTSNRDRSQAAEAEIDVAKAFTFLGDARHAPPRELINGLIPAEGVAVV